MKLLITILFLPILSFAKTEAAFIDACSNEPVRVATPNGTRLKVLISGLDPTDELELIVTFRPAGLVEDLGKKNTHQRTYYFGSYGDGSFFKRKINVGADGKLATYLPIPKEEWMWQVEQKNSEYRIWDAEIRWFQLRSRNAGSTVTTFYRAPKELAFFELNSEGLCQWETAAEVASKLYENHSTTWMNVVRETVKIYDQSSGPGISLGYNNNTGGSQPLGVGNTSDQMGWLFKDWEKQLGSEQVFKFERKFILNKEESGVFISRLSFNRHKARRFGWKKSSGQCGAYRPLSEGYLDVGQNSEDFIVLPKNLYGRSEDLKKFINSVRPTINNCGDNELTGPQFASDIIPSGTNGILYYYIRSNQ